MAKLNIDQKNIKDLFEDKKSDFLIPNIKGHMRGTKMNAKLYGTIFLNLHSPIIMSMISIVKKNII